MLDFRAFGNVGIRHVENDMQTIGFGGNFGGGRRGIVRVGAVEHNYDARLAFIDFHRRTRLVEEILKRLEPGGKLSEWKRFTVAVEHFFSFFERFLKVAEEKVEFGAVSGAQFGFGGLKGLLKPEHWFGGSRSELIFGGTTVGFVGAVSGRIPEIVVGGQVVEPLKRPQIPRSPQQRAALVLSGHAGKTAAVPDRKRRGNAVGIVKNKRLLAALKQFMHRGLLIGGDIGAENVDAGPDQLGFHRSLGAPLTIVVGAVLERHAVRNEGVGSDHHGKFQIGKVGIQRLVNPAGDIAVAAAGVEAELGLFRFGCISKKQIFLRREVVHRQHDGGSAVFGENAGTVDNKLNILFVGKVHLTHRRAGRKVHLKHHIDGVDAGGALDGFQNFGLLFHPLRALPVPLGAQADAGNLIRRQLKQAVERDTFRHIGNVTFGPLRIVGDYGGGHGFAGGGCCGQLVQCCGGVVESAEVGGGNVKGGFAG